MKHSDFEVCDFCKTGRVIFREEVLRFRQDSQDGVLHCEVVVPVGRCEACSSPHVDEEADAAIQAEVERARAALAGQIGK